MATFKFEGWRQATIKQSFDIEADSKAEAVQKLFEQQNNYELENHWFDYNTNKIKGDCDIDFYDQDGNQLDG